MTKMRTNSILEKKPVSLAHEQPKIEQPKSEAVFDWAGSGAAGAFNDDACRKFGTDKQTPQGRPLESWYSRGIHKEGNLDHTWAGAKAKTQLVKEMRWLCRNLGQSEVAKPPRAFKSTEFGQLMKNLPQKDRLLVIIALAPYIDSKLDVPLLNQAVLSKSDIRQQFPLLDNYAFDYCAATLKGWVSFSEHDTILPTEKLLDVAFGK